MTLPGIGFVYENEPITKEMHRAFQGEESKQEIISKVTMEYANTMAGCAIMLSIFGYQDKVKACRIICKVLRAQADNLEASMAKAAEKLGEVP